MLLLVGFIMASVGGVLWLMLKYHPLVILPILFVVIAWVLGKVFEIYDEPR